MILMTRRGLHDRRLPRCPWALSRKGVCVSTVSIVRGCDEGPAAWAQVDQIIDFAGAADGADGTFATRAHADHSRSCSALARESNLDAQRPQECLRSPQSAGKLSRRFWPTGASLPKLITSKIGCT